MNRANVPVKGSTPTCPSASEVPLAKGQTCNPPGNLSDDKKRCIYSIDTLDMSTTGLVGLTNPDGTPNLNSYFYDKTTGMLYFYVAQREPNPIAPSPLGSCTGNPSTDDPSCPDFTHGESYWACPAPGCTVYTINLTDTNYNPGPSNCNPYLNEVYGQNPPANQDQLYLLGTSTKVKSVINTDMAKVPFYKPDSSTAPMCDATQP